jgi:hypothetical protein
MAEQTPDIVPELEALRTPPKAFNVPAPKELTGLSTEMGKGVPGVPEDFVAARAKFKKPTDVSTEQARMLQQQGKLEQDIGMATQAKEQYIAEAKADIATQERQAAQNIEANLEATRKKFPYPEFHPTKDNIESLSTLFGLIGVIGASLGGAGKMSATASLNAMGGMMKGWQQGRADLWKKEKDEFDKGMQKVKAVLEDAYKDADRAMKTLAYNRSEAEALANQSAAKLGGQVGKQILAKQGVERYFQYLDGVKKDLTHAEDMAFKREEARKREAEAERRHKESMALQREKLAAQERRGARGGAAQETAIRVMQQDIGNAKYNLEDLKEAGEKAGKLPGGSVAFANYFKGDIKSDIIRYATNQFVETDLQSNDALMLNLAFDIASAQSGGRGQLSDAKVRAVVAQMPLDEQPEDTKSTKWAALMTRVNEANKSMPEDKRIEIPKQIQEYYMGRRLGRGEGNEQSSQPVRISPEEASRITGMPIKNEDGWTIEGDGKGGFAYVSPDRKNFKEIE